MVRYVTAEKFFISPLRGFKFSMQVSEDNFGRVKETLMRRYQNANLKVDYQATNLRLRCLKQIWPAEDKLLALAELQPQTTQATLLLYTLPSFCEKNKASPIVSFKYPYTQSWSMSCIFP